MNWCLTGMGNRSSTHLGLVEAQDPAVEMDETLANGICLTDQMAGFGSLFATAFASRISGEVCWPPRDAAGIRCLNRAPGASGCFAEALVTLNLGARLVHLVHLLAFPVSASSGECFGRFEAYGSSGAVFSCSTEL